LLRKLRDKGNTMLVVEHDPDVILVADHVIDMGPGAGSAGGEVVFQGSYAELLEADTPTGRHLRRTLPIKETFRQPAGKLPIRNARANNLQDVSVDVPTGVLVAITGVAGSGKSSLIDEVFLRQHPDAVVMDQSAVGTSTRSNPATYTGVMDDMRKAFASANGVDAGLFSFNSKGACENCNGSGVIYTDLAFLDTVKTPCEVCQGHRFKEEVLAYKLNGQSITDVLAMTVARALEFFANGDPASNGRTGRAALGRDIGRKLQAMHDVGLGYLTLGQPLSTLSGGECQRIKLASELHKHGSIYVLDEPTTGLHLSDIGNLLAILNRLVDGGNTVIVIEHNMDVVRNADWIVDLGPEGGSKGGRVVFEGTPRQILDAPGSLTGQYLARPVPSAR
jgi:excinuclease UvrABC ATPase subunit